MKMSEPNHGLQSSSTTAPMRFIKGRAPKLMMIIEKIVMIFGALPLMNLMGAVVLVLDVMKSLILVCI